MTVFGRSYAHTGLSQPMKTVVWGGCGLDAGNCVRDMEGENRGIDRCFTKRGKPQGLFRFFTWVPPCWFGASVGALVHGIHAWHRATRVPRGSSALVQA